jgi:hypothetical protein
MEKFYDQALEICYNLLDDCQLISIEEKNLYLQALGENAESVCYKFPAEHLHNIEKIMEQWSDYDEDDEVCPFATEKHLLDTLEDVFCDTYAYDPTVSKRNSAFLILPEEYYLKLQMLLILSRRRNSFKISKR